jgi:membrane-anchored protein YejM (alkaline phosphatase superfamily)
LKTAVKNRINISVLCFWFFILNIPLFWLVALRYFWGALIPDGWLADFYTVISYFPNIAILALLVNLLCFVVAIIWPKRLFIIILAIILNTVALFGIVIDASVFQLFHFHINWQYFDLIFSAQGRSVLDLGFSDWVLIAIILSLILFIEIGLAFLIVKKNYFKVFKRWMVYALIILLCCSFIEIAIFACAKATAYYPILEAGIHFPIYFRPHANKLVKKLHIFKIKHVSEYRFPRKSFDYPLHSSHSNDVKSSKMNVMMILIDTWRYDMMNPQTSPDIYKFSRNALVFNNHFSSGNMTKAGIFGLFYSIPIYYWSLTIDKHRMPLLMKILQQNKYQTAIYASAPLDMPYTFNKTVFQDIKHLQITTPGASPVARDKYITKEMLRFLHNHKPHNKPFFGFLFYDSVHAYSFPKNFPAKFKPYKRY